MSCKRFHGSFFSRRRALLAVFLALAVSATLAQSRILDTCDSADAWTAIPSDGVRASLSTVDGLAGKALRLTYNFEAGSGFCVIRHPLPLDLPPEYRFSFHIRGDSPANNLEFKLIDPSGENVWWVNQRAYEFPTEWTKVTLRSRRFQFAWGPAGGATPLTKTGAIEIAIAASSGGKGTIDIDQLTFEPIPPRGEPQPIRVSFSPSKDGSHAPVELPPDWKLTRSVGPPWPRPRRSVGDPPPPPMISLDLGGIREFGGLIIDWDESNYPRDLDVEASLDGTTFETVAQVRGARGGRRYIQIPEGEAAHLRIRIIAVAIDNGVGLTRLELAPPEFGQSANAMFARIARDAPRGWYPRYFLGEQQPWTVIGVEGDHNEALMDAAGAIELAKGGPRLEPFLYVDGKLISWADAQIDQSNGTLGPSVRWIFRDVTLWIEASADGPPGQSRIVVTYSVLCDRPAAGTRPVLFLALRPFQVLPPWHELNLTGGASRVREIVRNDQLVLADGRPVLPWVELGRFGAGPLEGGEIVEHLARGELPPTEGARGDFSSAAIAFDLETDRATPQTIPVTLALHRIAADDPCGMSEPAAEARLSERMMDLQQRSDDRWKGRARLYLPQRAAAIAETFHAMQQYILINADGARIQPGSRTYERSWIRDGSMTGTALLVTGHGDKMRDFLDWYGPFQYPSGKIPCVVDSRGPDPVPENDSHGQYIYAVATYYRFTHDREFLERHFPRVEKAVAYIESLRAQRMTDEFKNGPPEKRMLFGLVPESISHEGYSAKPMHSYWDGFFTIRGLSDAAYLAREVELRATGSAREVELRATGSAKFHFASDLQNAAALAEKWQALADDYRKCMYDSMRLTMDLHKIDYISGCAELGDFDATSTAIGVFPCGERGRIPEPQLTNTFERYLKFFRDRRDGKIEWREFTPYEVRLVGAFVLMGRPDEAHELLDWFFQYQRPAGWSQWGEVAYHDENYPGFVGDMPHTWVGGDFVNSVRNMFVYERDDTLVLAAGVPKRWLENPDSLAIERFRTPVGSLSYSLNWSPTELVCRFLESNDAQPTSFDLAVPGDRPIGAVEIDGQAIEPPRERVVSFGSGVDLVRVRFR